MYHIPSSAPVQYFSRLPRQCESDVAYIVDPVIASAGTILSVIAMLKKVSVFCFFGGATVGWEQQGGTLLGTYTPTCVVLLLLFEMPLVF